MLSGRLQSRRERWPHRLPAVRTACRSRVPSTPTGLLKKHARCGSAPLSPRRWAQSRQPGQVDHQRRGQQRVAPLPGELQHHLRAEEALEVDVVPGGLPVVQRFDVLDRHDASAACSRAIPPSSESLLFTLLALLSGSSSTCPSRLPRMLWPDPAQDAQVAPGEHRGQHRSSSASRRSCRPARRGARRACAASSSMAGQRRAAARRHVHVGEAGVDGGEGVDAARRQAGGVGAVEGRAAVVRATSVRRRARRAVRSRPRSPPRPDRAVVAPGTLRRSAWIASIASRGVRGLPHVGPVGQRRDRRVRPVHDAGPDVRRPRFEVVRHRRPAVGSSKTFDRSCSSRTAERSVAWRMSWPPRTNCAGSSRSSPANCGRAVTMTGGRRRAREPGRTGRGRWCRRRRRSPDKPQADAPLSHE